MRPLLDAFRRTSLAAVALALGVATPALAQGRLTTPESPVYGGSSVDVRWTGLCEVGSDLQEVELVLSLDGGVSFPVRITPEMSSCTSRFRWRVPSLPTAHARLALRAGSGGRNETERLELFSGEFAIVASGEEPLIRGASEWWTRQALSEVSAVDRLTDSLGAAPERLTLPASSSEISDPGIPLSTAPDRACARHDKKASAARPSSPRSVRPASFLLVSRRE